MLVTVEIKIVERGDIIVEADSKEEAENIVADMYESGDFIFNDEETNGFKNSLTFTAISTSEIS